MGLGRILNYNDVNVSACLVDAYEDYSCFGEVGFSKVSKWYKEQRLSFV
jgi:hypothetical protein